LVGRYYDPATGQFLSVDPLVDETGQPYAYADDDPVNGVDPNGLDCGIFSFACSAYDAAAGGVKTAALDTGHFMSDPSRWRAEASTWAGVGNFFVNFFQPNPGLGLPHANVANPYPCSDGGYYTFGNYISEPACLPPDQLAPGSYRLQETWWTSELRTSLRPPHESPLMQMVTWLVVRSAVSHKASRLEP
jgi:hypothetical protein